MTKGSNITWGPDLWHVIHNIAKNYPKHPSNYHKNACLQFVKMISYILPCQKCQRHYMANITKHPVNPHSGLAFFTWTVQLHNSVNRQTSRKKKIYSVREGFLITDSTINSTRLKRLLQVLFKESHSNFINPIHLRKFIDCISFLSKPHKSSWHIDDNQKGPTSERKVDVRSK